MSSFQDKKDPGQWREIQYGRHNLPKMTGLTPRREEDEEPRTHRIESPFRCVLEGKPKETCPACAAGVPKKTRPVKQVSRAMQSVLDLVEFKDQHIKLARREPLAVWVTNVSHDGDRTHTMEFYGVGDKEVMFGRPATMKNARAHIVYRLEPVKDAERYAIGVGIYIEFKAWCAWNRKVNKSRTGMTDKEIEADLNSRPSGDVAGDIFVHDESGPVDTFVNQFYAMKKQLAESGWDVRRSDAPIYKIYEGPVDRIKHEKLPDIDEGFGNPCGEVALSKPEPNYIGCIDGPIGYEYPDDFGPAEYMFPELTADNGDPKFNLANYPHTCGCGARCYNSGYRIECTGPTCRHYKEPK